MRSILSYLGIGILIVGLCLLFPALVAFISAEPFLPFLIPAAFSIIAGLALSRLFKRENLSFEHALIFATLLFFTIAAIGAVPYLYSPSFTGTISDAYFESMSGFTTTGLSVISSVESQPASLLFWRALTQWIGGIGIVVLFLSLLMQPGMSASYLYRAEGRDQRIWPSIVRTSREQLKIYLLLTALGTAILFAVGAPLLDSLSHIITSVSTGGFSTHTSSIEALELFGNKWLVDAVVIIFMLAGSTNFVLHNSILRGKVKDYFRNIEVRYFYLFLFLFTALLAYDQWAGGDASFLRHSLFQAVSALTTTGFSNQSISGLSSMGKYILIILMILGGSSGSTSGGIKMVRISLLLNSIPWSIRRLVLPKGSVVPLKVGNASFSDSQAMMVSLYSFAYIFLLFAGTGAIMLEGFDFMPSLFESTSAIGTVGLTLGITPQLGLFSKAIVTLEMLLGRLEIIPLLATLLMLTKTRSFIE